MCCFVDLLTLNDVKFFVFCSVINVTDQIFAAVKEIVTETGSKSIKVTEIMERCTTKGFKPDQIDECLEEYEDLNVWQINHARTRLTFV